jgi:cytochrome c-type protein NapC
MVSEQKESGWIRGLWRWFWRPSATLSLGVLLLAGFLGGIVFWGGFHWAVELTNTETFCISCHEMEQNVYAELQDTIHFVNRTGVRAICSDCHVPKDWFHKIKRKIEASNEVFHKVIGTVDTPEKFEAHRLAMAKSVWASMKASDSRECRNCHQKVWMDMSAQFGGSKRNHTIAQKNNLTCIDCHQGIAHHLPAGFERPTPQDLVKDAQAWLKDLDSK